MTQLDLEEQALVGADAAGESPDESVVLGAQPPAGEVRERIGIEASSAWVPSSTILPPSITKMRSAASPVASRWAMTSVVRPCISVVQRFLHQPFVLGVERRGRLVEQQDRRVLQNGAGDGEALALAAGQGDAALAQLACRSPAAAPTKPPPPPARRRPTMSPRGSLGAP